MKHLADLHFVHRDLAARNVLLSSGMQGKVADFGLSRGFKDPENESSDYYRARGNTPIPIRWTAPEALDTNKYSTASDVWSFAIMITELYLNAAKGCLYPGLKNADVMQKVVGGHQHSRPAGCNNGMHELLLKCWSFEPNERPTFDTIIEVVEFNWKREDGSVPATAIVDQDGYDMPSNGAATAPITTLETDESVSQVRLNSQLESGYQYAKTLSLQQQHDTHQQQPSRMPLGGANPAFGRDLHEYALASEGGQGDLTVDGDPEPLVNEGTVPGGSRADAFGAPADYELASPKALSPQKHHQHHQHHQQHQQQQPHQQHQQHQQPHRAPFGGLRSRGNAERTPSHPNNTDAAFDAGVVGSGGSRPRAATAWDKHSVHDGTRERGTTIESTGHEKGGRALASEGGEGYLTVDGAPDRLADGRAASSGSNAEASGTPADYELASPHSVAADPNSVAADRSQRSKPNLPGNTISPPAKGKGIKRDVRKASVYLGFDEGNDNDETRL
jgi:serine/threonine protein kinase